MPNRQPLYRDKVRLLIEQAKRACPWAVTSRQRLLQAGGLA